MDHRYGARVPDVPAGKPLGGVLEKQAEPDQGAETSEKRLGSDWVPGDAAPQHQKSPGQDVTEHQRRMHTVAY